jgi:hypothetical protein
MTVQAENITLPGNRTDAELKLAQMLVSGLISSFVLENSDKQEGMRFGHPSTMPDSGSSLYVRYIAGRGKHLFGLVNEVASEAQELPSIRAVAPLITQLINDLKQGGNWQLSQLVYEDSRGKPWNSLTDASKVVYAEKLNSILLEDLQHMLNDIQFTVQNLNDFDLLWGKIWPLRFKQLDSVALKNVTIQYSYILTSIFRLVNIIESRGQLIDGRCTYLVNVAASISFIERMWINQYPTIDSRKRLSDVSSSDPAPKRLAPSDHLGTICPSENRESISDMILSDTKYDKMEEPNLNGSSNEPFSTDLNRNKRSSIVTVLAILIHRIMHTNEVTNALDIEQVDSELEQQIDTKRKQLERAVSGYCADDTVESSIPPFLPCNLNLSIPLLIWNSTTSSQDLVIMKLKQIYYKLLDRRYQSNVKENVKYVDDIMIRNQISMRKILEEPGGSSAASALSHKETIQKVKSLEKAQNKSIPKVYTLAIELGEWSMFIISAASSGQSIRPSVRLDSFFTTPNDGASQNMKYVMVSTLNDAFSSMSKYYNGNNGEKYQIDSDGVISTTFSQNKKLSADVFVRGTLYLFYYNLEAILVSEASRMKLPLRKLLERPSFYRALYTFSCICLYRATGGPMNTDAKTVNFNGSAPYVNSVAQFILALLHCPPINYLRVSEAVVRALVRFDQPLKKDIVMKITTPSSELARESSRLPSILFQYLRQEEDSLLESQIWVSTDNIFGSSETFWSLFEKLGPLRMRLLDCRVNSKPSQGFNFVVYIIRRVLVISSKRISSLCTRLSISPGCLVADQIWGAFLYFIRNAIEIIKDRHLDQIILCTVYGVFKAVRYDPALTFAHLIKEYTILRKDDIGERACVHIVREAGIGDIVHFYNTVYLPAMKDHLMNEHYIEEGVMTTCDKAVDIDHKSTIKFSVSTCERMRNFRQPGLITHVHTFGSVEQFSSNNYIH